MLDNIRGSSRSRSNIPIYNNITWDLAILFIKKNKCIQGLINKNKHMLLIVILLSVQLLLYLVEIN